MSIRQFTERYEVHLEPLPCWEHLAESEWRGRDKMIDAYRDFEAAYRLATDLLRSGQWDVAFPPGCWKPHLLVPGPG